MALNQIIKVQVLDALWALDERHGGFKTLDAANTIIEHLADRLPSLQVEESGDLFRIYEPLSEQYFWPEKPNFSTLTEAADKMVADIIAATGKQPTDLPTFEFTITRDVTESARVRVKAVTIEQAQRIALKPEFYMDFDKAPFAFDDGNVPPVPYLPDVSDYVIARGDGWDAIDSVTGNDAPVLGMEDSNEDPSP